MNTTKVIELYNSKYRESLFYTFTYKIESKHLRDKVKNIITKSVLNMERDVDIYKGVRKVLVKHNYFLNMEERGSFRLDGLKRHIKEWKDLQPTSYLDIGCFKGDITADIGKHFNLTKSHVHGVDIKDYDKTDDTLEHMTFHLYDGRTLPFEDNSFDLITSFAVLHHVEDISTLTKELSRVMMPGGALIIREHDANPSDKLEIYLLELLHEVYDFVLNPNLQDTWMTDSEGYYNSAGYWKRLMERNDFIPMTLAPAKRKGKSNPYNNYYASFRKKDAVVPEELGGEGTIFGMLQELKSQEPAVIAQTITPDSAPWNVIHPDYPLDMFYINDTLYTSISDYRQREHPSLKELKFVYTQRFNKDMYAARVLASTLQEIRFVNIPDEELDIILSVRMDVRQHYYPFNVLNLTSAYYQFKLIPWIEHSKLPYLLDIFHRLHTYFKQPTITNKMIPTILSLFFSQCSIKPMRGNIADKSDVLIDTFPMQFMKSMLRVVNKHQKWKHVWGYIDDKEYFVQACWNVIGSIIYHIRQRVDWDYDSYIRDTIFKQTIPMTFTFNEKLNAILNVCSAIEKVSTNLFSKKFNLSITMVELVCMLLDIPFVRYIDANTSSNEFETLTLKVSSKEWSDIHVKDIYQSLLDTKPLSNQARSRFFYFN